MKTNTPAHTREEEIASFTDTGKTVTHRGVTYAILNPPADEERADSPWVLRNSKGRYYALTRNRPKPHLLFGISLYHGMKVLPGWFSDKDGELKSLG